MNELVKKINEMIKEHDENNWCEDFYNAETIEQGWESGKYETLTRLLEYIKEL